MTSKNYPQNGCIFRVHKTENYTLMHNHHLKNKELPLKAKGLLSVIFSLPPEWNFSINGLAALSLDGRDSILTIIKILQDTGYMFLEKVRNDKGQFDTIYNVYEEPQNFEGSTESENPTRYENVLTESENPSRENRVGAAESENTIQLNTNISKTKKSKTNKKYKKKNTYGEFKNVYLTNEHILQLNEIYKSENKVNEAIEILSSYKESSGKTYKNDYAVLGSHNWVFKKVFPKGVKKESPAENKNKESAVPDYESVSRW